MKSRIADIERNIGPQVIGRIKIGEKALNKYNVLIPRSLDHFIAQSKHYQNDYNEIIGDNASKITIVFVSDDQMYSCREYYEWRDDKGKFIASGDGNEIEAFKINPDGTSQNIVFSAKDEKVIQRLSAYKKRHVLRLRFMIAGIDHIYGTWELKTYGSAASIGPMLQAIDTVYATTGTIVGIPFDLAVEIVKSDKAGEMKRYPVISLTPNVSMHNLSLISRIKKENPSLLKTIMSNDYLNLVAKQMDNNYLLPGTNEIKELIDVPDELLSIADKYFESAEDLEDYSEEVYYENEISQEEDNHAF